MPTYRRLEKGHISKPSPNVLHALATPFTTSRMTHSWRRPVTSRQRQASAADGKG